MTGGLRTRRLLRVHLVAGLGATATVAAVVAVLAGLAVFAPLAVGSMLDASTRYLVSSLSGPVRDLSTSIATIPVPGAGAAPTGSLPEEYHDTWGTWDSGLRDILTQAPASVRAVHGDADYYARLGEPARYASATNVDFDPRFASRITVTEGRLPQATVTEQEWNVALDARMDENFRPVDGAEPLPASEIVLSAASADEVDWKIGETRISGDESGWVLPVPLTLVGTFEAVDASDPHWAREVGVLEPSIAFDPDGVPYVRTAAFAAPETFGDFALLNAGAITEAWYPLDPEKVTAAAAPQLLADLRGFLATPHRAPGFGGAGVPMSFQAGVVPTLEATIAQNRALVSALAMLVAGPIGVALAVLVLACRLMHEHRRSSLDLLAARGAAPGQLRGVLGLEGLIAGLVPAAAGAALGLALAVATLPGAAPASALLLVPAILALVPAAVGVATATLSRGRERADAPARRSRRRPVVEAGVVALAVLATALLVLRGTDATATVDPLAVAAPLLLALVACVLTLRLYPVALRSVLARERSREGFLGVLGAARALRDPATGVAPVLALIVGVSFAVASAVVLSMVQTGAVHAARATAGADIQLSASRFDAEAVATAEAVDGVAAVARVDLLRSAQLKVEERLSRVSLYLVDRERLDEVQSDFPRIVPADVSLGDGSGVPRLLFSEEVADRIDAAELPVHIVKADAAFAGAVREAVPFTSSSSSWVLADVAYAEQISDDAPIPVRLLVRVAPGADPAAVAAELRETFGAGVRVATSADALDAVYADPAFAGLRGALVAGVLVCAVLSAVAVVVTLVLGTRPRRRILALLQTLGAPPRAARGLVAWELAPAGIAALIVGGILGMLMPVLLASVVDLRPFTRGVDPPSYAVDPLVLLSTLGGFAVVTLLVTGAALAITRRARVAAVLRTVEET
ncbi:ABC transporter permease [Microbacterium sp. LMI12-1-1.1]|uniref:ABC transporter permease n=1 Tax=Microbacterium sp. LMI12-1-1.1 TaxID=3135225 RepID=UPI00341CDD12